MFHLAMGGEETGRQESKQSPQKMLLQEIQTQIFFCDFFKILCFTLC